MPDLDCGKDPDASRRQARHQVFWRVLTVRDGEGSVGGGANGDGRAHAGARSGIDKW